MAWPETELISGKGVYMALKISPETYVNQIDNSWPDGVKKTRQRVEIYNILSTAKEPLSAAEIFARVLENNKEAGYAFSTVYRSLLAFEKAGMVTKSVLVSEDTAVYELNSGKIKHYAVCLKCHKKISLKGCPLSNLRPVLSTEGLEDFMVTGHQIEIYGYCKNCRMDMV